MRRASTICSPLTTSAKVKECCCDLKCDYDLDDAIRTASILFFRLSGRQPKYAGVCTNTVRPCFPQMCYCGTCDGCCSCTLDSIKLPGVCEIVQVVINGLIIDPATYAIQSDRLVSLGCNWPLCQNLKHNSAPVKVYNNLTTPSSPASYTVLRNADGTFTFDSVVFASLGDADIIHIVGTEGTWDISVSALTVDGPDTIYNPADIADSDVERVANSNLLNSWRAAPGPFDAEINMTNAVTTYREYFDRPFYSVADDPEGTFEITYKTGCTIPLEVQSAVAILACEMAKARCGDTTCRLSPYLRSATYDSVSVSQIDFLTYIQEGLTGIPECDRVIKSLNPNKLARSARVVSGYTYDRRLNRFL